MKWIICFAETHNVGTWRLFTFWRKGFSHVFAVRYEPELDAWMKYECASQRFNFDVYCDSDADLLVAYMINDCKCVEIKADTEVIQTPRWLYCVSFVKHILGIRGMFLLTPYQLYCELLKRGGEIIFEKDKGDFDGIHVASTA